MKVGWLDRGIWGSFSDLLGDLSALSSYEDALAEAVYEELDYLLTQKEGLGSPGECLICPAGISGCHHPLAMHIFSASADPMCAPGSDTAPQERQNGLSDLRDLPASVYTAGARPAPSQP